MHCLTLSEDVDETASTINMLMLRLTSTLMLSREPRASEFRSQSSLRQSQNVHRVVFDATTKVVYSVYHATRNLCNNVPTIDNQSRVSFLIW